MTEKIFYVNDRLMAEETVHLEKVMFILPKVAVVSPGARIPNMYKKEHPTILSYGI